MHASELVLSNDDELISSFERAPSFLVVSHAGNTAIPTVGSVVLAPAD